MKTLKYYIFADLKQIVGGYNDNRLFKMVLPSQRRVFPIYSVVSDSLDVKT